MMDPFRRLPGSVRSPAGFERVILRWWWRIGVFGTLGLLLPALVVRLLATGADQPAIPIGQSMSDIYAVAGVILFWTLMLVLGIGALIVMIMKGPGYVADAYPVSHRDTPAPSRPHPPPPD